MAKKEKKSVDIPETLKNEFESLQNGLNTAILGYNPGTPVSTQLSQVTSLFINNRWYLISNMRQLLSEMYVEHGLIQTIVDVPVDDGLRGGVEISTKQLDPEEIEDLQAEMEMEGDYETVGYANKWNRLFGGAGVLVMTDQDPATPLNMNALRPDSPLEFRDVDMWELFWSKQNTSDYSAAIDTNQLNDVEFYDYYGKQVHKSRVMKLIGYKAPSFIRPRLRGWGVSVVESLVQSLNQYLKSKNLTYEVLDEFKIDIFKLKNLTSTLMSPMGDAKVRARVQLANQQKNYQHAITMDAEDDYQQKELSFAGIAETQAGIRMQIASDMRMPLTKVFGISSAGFNSGEDDIENYNAMIESQVRNRIKAPLLRLIQIRCQRKFGFVPDDLKIKFKPLRMLSAEQEENVKTQKFNRVLAAKSAGEITSLEFRDSVNKDNLLPIQLDTSIVGLDDQAAQSGDDDTLKAVKGAKSPDAKLAPSETKNAEEASNEPVKKKAFSNALDKYLDFAGPKIVTVGLISGDEILTGRRRDNGKWTNPGGHMDEGEEIQDAAVREVLEETGIQIDKSQLTHISSEMINSHRTGKDFVVHVFTASIPKKKGDIKADPDKEFSVLKWVKIHPDTPELKPENRHAKVDSVLVHLFGLNNSLEYDVASFYADGGEDAWSPWHKREVENPNPQKMDLRLLARAKEASQKAFGKQMWQFVLWWYKKNGGKS